MNYFENIEGAEKAVIRPEFVRVTKKNEVQSYKSSAMEGVVERVSFRGDNLELRVRIRDIVLTAKRGLEEAPVTEGESVDVFVYKIFVVKGNQVTLVNNSSIREESLVI